MRYFVLIVISLSISGWSSAQHVAGMIRDSQNEPVPFANIFFQELQDGTSSRADGSYYFRLLPGNYRMTVAAIGYEQQTLNVQIGDEPYELDVWLNRKDRELNQVVINAKRRDPAFGIIQQVIEHRDQYRYQMQSLRSKLYIKATEEVDVVAKDKKRKPIIGFDSESDDPLERGEAAKAEIQELTRLSMAEIEMTFNYQAPNDYKEERTAIKRYGNQQGLYMPTFSEATFNFYENLLYIPDLTLVPIISPISRTAILSYRYELIETKIEGELTVHTIKVTPRKQGNSTLSGLLYVNDRLWNINRLELALPRGGLKFYDQFTIRQGYELVQDSIWFPTREEYIYFTKQGKRTSFSGSTVLKYSSLQPNYVFPRRFFGAEVAVADEATYTRDSVYWENARPEPLSDKQMRMMHYRDSVKQALQDPKYLDSLDAQYNKITLGDLAYAGLGFQNHHKKRHLYFNSLLGLVTFEAVGGFRISPYFSHFKRWENQQYLSASYSASVGLKNGDLMGSADLSYRYDPFRQGQLNLSVGRSFYSINPFDAYLNQLRIGNYILNYATNLSHRIELFNGFYLYHSVAWRDRQSLNNYDADTFLNGWNWIGQDSALTFEDYQAVITEMHISYTPGQRYIREPNRKVVLGSKYPTFLLLWRRGWDRLIGSDVNFDFLSSQINYNLQLGVLGSSKMTLEAGQFVNTKDLRLVDVKRFRQSDPILYSDPLNTFQLLDTALQARGPYLEYHFIHHFNGALVNNLPLIKKTRISLVAGGGALWVQESNYRYEELFGGIERVFKLGARRRIRIGVYGVVSNSNAMPFNADFKVSFDVIDVWKKSWSY